MTRLFCIPLFILLALTSACTPTGKAKVNDDNVNLSGDIGSVFGEGITFGGPDKGTDNIGSNIAVNSFLWRAALDTLSFMPLNQVDPFGGVILSDWYANPQNATQDAGQATGQATTKSLTQRYKLNVYILTRKLRSDGVKVSVFKQMRDPDNQWQDVTVQNGTATQIENSILTRARQMRINYQNQFE